MIIKLQNLRPNTTYQLQVRARSSDGRVSEFSPTYNLVIGGDTEPPYKPSNPIASSRMGTISIQWDGNNSVGEPMGPDLAYIKIHADVNAVFSASDSNEVGRLYGPGIYILSDLPYNVVYYFRFVAYDVSGNYSLPSDAVPTSAIPIVSTDFIGKIINGANIVDGSLVAADKLVANSIYSHLIATEQIISDKIAANSITAAKIQTGAITAEKISVGTVSSHPMKNPNFEEMIPDGQTPTTGVIRNIKDVNGSVISKIDSWPTTSLSAGGGDAYTIEGVARIGRRALRLETIANIANTGASVISDPFPIESGVTYTFSLWHFTSHADNTTASATVTLTTDTISSFSNTPANYTIANLLPTNLIYEQHSGGDYTIPSGDTWGRITITWSAATSSNRVLSWTIDDIGVHRVGYTGSQLTGAGLKIWDSRGKEVVSLSGTEKDSIKISGGMASIEADGDVNGKNASFESLVVGNRTFGDVETDWTPRGIIAYGIRTSANTQTAATGHRAVLEIRCSMPPRRLYRIATNSFLISSSTSGNVQAMLVKRGVGDGDPWNSGTYDSAYGIAYSRVNIPVAANRMAVKLETLYVSAGDEENRILLAVDGTSVYAHITADSPVILYVEDLGPAYADVGVIRADSTLASNNKVLTTSTFPATWSRSFNAAGNMRYDDPAECYHGYYSSTHGNQKSMVGFQDLTSTLSGVSIKAASLTLKNLSTGQPSGLTDVNIGFHTNAAKPASFINVHATTVAGTNPVGSSSLMTIDLLSYMSLFASTVRGVTIGPADDSTLNRYGYFAGYGQAGAPYLTVSYVN